MRRADVFWAVDSGAIGLVADAGLARPLPADITEALRPGFQYPQWAPVTGRIRTIPYNTERVTRERKAEAEKIDARLRDERKKSEPREPEPKEPDPPAPPPRANSGQCHGAGG